MDFVFWIFFIWATVTEISVEIRKCDQPTDQRTNLDMEVLETLACLKIGCTFHQMWTKVDEQGVEGVREEAAAPELEILQPREWGENFQVARHPVADNNVSSSLRVMLATNSRSATKLQNFRFEKEAFCKSKQHLSWYMKSISSIWGHTSDTNFIWVIKAGFCSVLYRKERKPGRLNGRNSIHSPRSSSPSTAAENVQAFNNVWAHFYQGAQLPAVAICRPVVQGLTEKLPSWQTSEKMHFISLQHVLAFTFLNILKEC